MKLWFLELVEANAVEKGIETVGQRVVGKYLSVVFTYRPKLQEPSSLMGPSWKECEKRVATRPVAAYEWIPHIMLVSMSIRLPTLPISKADWDALSTLKQRLDLLSERLSDGFTRHAGQLIDAVEQAQCDDDGVLRIAVLGTEQFPAFLDTCVRPPVGRWLSWAPSLTTQIQYLVVPLQAHEASTAVTPPEKQQLTPQQLVELLRHASHEKRFKPKRPYEEQCLIPYHTLARLGLLLSPTDGLARREVAKLALTACATPVVCEADSNLDPESTIMEALAKLPHAPSFMAKLAVSVKHSQWCNMYSHDQPREEDF